MNAKDALAKLDQSETYKNNVDVCGMCTRCKEYTGVFGSCCGASIWYEGGTIHGDDIISDISFDLGISEDEVIELLEDAGL